MGEIDVRILGTLDVRRSGERVDLGLRKARVLFGMLAINANRPVRMELLAEAMWDGTRPQQWESVIHSHVSRLRRSLEPGRAPRATSDRLQTHGGAYVLHLADDELDALRFERCLSDGRGALARGDVKAAHLLLEQAVREWRGDVLADIVDRLALATDVNRLDELRLVAREGFAEAAIAAGEHATVVPDLEALVNSHPLRERAWELLLLALYRSGRQAEALRRYHEVRSILVTELGIEPGAALRDLEQAILRQDALRAAGASPPDANPQVEVEVSSVAMPAWLQPPSDEFVGRAHERTALLRAGVTARSGERRLVLVTGDPGVGKTRLVREVCRELRDDGAIVLGGRCVESPLHVLQPFAEALGRLGSGLAEMLAGKLPAEVGTVAPLVPEFAAHAPSLPPLDADVQRYLMFRAISALLDGRVIGRPLVLVLDDLHWALPPALSLLAHVLGDGDRGSLLVVATARDAETNDEFDALLADMRRERRLERIALGGLEPDEVGRLAVARGSVGGSTDLFSMTAGNPFYIEELVRHVAESGGDLRGSSVPDSIRDTIARRLLRLPDDARRVLGIAAVCGERFRVDVLAGVASAPADEVEDSLAAAQQAGVVQPAARIGEHSFSHDLVRTVLRDGLGRAREARLHRRIGETLVALDGDDAEVAQHLLAAASDGSDVAPGAEAALRAARRAVSRYTYDDAIGVLRSARAALIGARVVDPALACRVAIQLCQVLRSAGEYEEREPLLAEAWDDACRSDDPELMADVIIEGCGGTINPAEPWPSRAETVRGRLDESSPRTLILAAIMCHVLSRRPGNGGRDLAEWALARAGSCSPAVRRSIINFSLSVVGAWSPIERVVDLARAAVEAAREDGDAPELVESLSALRRAYLAGGDLAKSDEIGREYEDLVRTIRIPRYQAGVAQRRAMRALLAGRFTEAQAHAEEAVALQPNAEFFEGLAVQLFAIRFLQGRLHEVKPAVEAWAQQNPRTGWTIGHAMLLTMTGDAEAGRAMLEPYVTARFENVPRDELYFLTLSTATMAVLQLGDRAAAEVLYELLAPHASRIIVAAEGAVCWGSIHRFLGPLAVVCEQPDLAAMHFEAAIAAHERLGALPFLAADRIAFADLLDASTRDTVRSGELRRTGLALARQLGLAVAATVP